MDEFAGDNKAWPKNVKGKPTHLAVIGVGEKNGRPFYEMTFSATYPDLDKAMYWGAKKEIEVIKGRRFTMASRVLWQHELTPEQAVAEMWTEMEPQVRRAISSADRGTGSVGSIGDGPMKPVDYSAVDSFYVEIEPPDPSNN